MPGSGSERVGRRAGVTAVVGGLGVVLALLWSGGRLGWLPGGTDAKVLVLYCFSTLDDVMEDRLLPGFRERWQRETGGAVEFVVTYAGSGDITKRILAEYPAQVAIVSSELDAHQLPTPWRSWRQLPHQGILVRTPLAIVTREGNPSGLRGFRDLGSRGVALLHGDPATSGAAQLAIIAAYGSELRRTGDGELARARLLGIWRNVTSRPATAREARNRFESGDGDALVTYLADVVGTPSRARVRGEIVLPTGTIVAEPVVVKIDKNIDRDRQRLVDAFVDFLWSREAQRSLVDYGFESVHEELNPVHEDPETLEDRFTLADVGGLEARAKILDRVWRAQVVPQLGR